MTDDGRREIHGATPMAGSDKEPLTVREGDTTIVVYHDFVKRFTLTAEGARFLARKLNRLALRIERRAAQGDQSPKGGDACGSVHASAGPKDAPETPSPANR